MNDEIGKRPHKSIPIMMTHGKCCSVGERKTEDQNDKI